MIYLAQGCIGDLERWTRKAAGVVAALMMDVYEQPMFMQSKRNGTVHRDDSLHYDGCAFDILYPTRLMSWVDLVSGNSSAMTEPERQEVATMIQLRIDARFGEGIFQVVAERFHVHVEKDPRATAVPA